MDHDSSGKKVGTTRRDFLAQMGLTGAGLTIAPLLSKAEKHIPDPEIPLPSMVTTHLSINGKPQTLVLESNVTLLDALRERLHMTGTKKGCDHGQCGACTVLMNGYPAAARTNTVDGWWLMVGGIIFRVFRRRAQQINATHKGTAHSSYRWFRKQIRAT